MVLDGMRRSQDDDEQNVTIGHAERQNGNKTVTGQNHTFLQLFKIETRNVVYVIPFTKAKKA